MRVGGSSRNNNTDNTVNIIELYNQIKYLKGIFTDVILVNPVEHEIIEVDTYNFNESDKKCTSICPLVKDKCGCICVDIASTKERRNRFIYDKTSAYLVIGDPISTKYRNYVLILIMKLNPSFSFGALSDTEAIDQITKISSNLVIDPLTDIFNRKYLMDNIDYLIQNSFKEKKQLCLACIDIDNFKKFNDTYGHEFGDLVLKSVAKLMQDSIQMLKEAYPIRIGGDEFVIVAIGIDKNRFKAIMSKLCVMIDNNKLRYGNQLVSIKISIGVAELFSDKVNNYKELYTKADTQLYLAKEAGKGCVR